jgi:alanine-synthesizing transaminase
VNPKYLHNIAAAIRAASCFDVTRLVWTGSRTDISPLERLPREERMKGYKDVVWTNDKRDKPLAFFRSDVTPVCVELLEHSEPLTTFEHPENAVYVFGPEDGGVPQVIRRLCHRFVHIQANHCLNLAAAVNVVLHDRKAKLQLKGSCRSCLPVKCSKNIEGRWRLVFPAGTGSRSLVIQPLVATCTSLTLKAMEEFSRIQRLPPYVFNITGEMKVSARRRGEDIIDFGMGNPDGATPKHIVDKMIEAAQKPATHRYSVSRGLPRLRRAISNWYKTRYDVALDPDTETIVTIGSKEGIAHLCLAILDSRDTVLVPNPSYPIHIYGPVIAGAHVVSVPIVHPERFLAELEDLIPRMTPRPKALIVNFPSNPTTQCVELPFLARLVELARQYGFHLIHDLAYADIAFDGYKPPSVLQVPGAKEVAVEFFTLSKSYNMPGWRVGFMVGSPVLVNALARLKSYFDYGTFTPIQVASILALEGPQDCVGEICENYRSRRNVLVEGLNKLAWQVPLPKATMFVWAQIPEPYRHLGSLEFSKRLLTEAKVAVSPGIGFGDYGDAHVRFSLIENEERTRQALRGIKQMLAKVMKETAVPAG